jgi:hypothetical protein
MSVMLTYFAFFVTLEAISTKFPAEKGAAAGGAQPETAKPETSPPGYRDFAGDAKRRFLVGN